MATAADDPGQVPEELVTAGDFARQTGLSRKTLRGYEEIGLITPHAVDGVTGFRYFHPDQIELGALLGQLRTAGVPRADLVRLVEALGQDMTAPQSAADALKTMLYEQARALRSNQLLLHQIINRLTRSPGNQDLTVTDGRSPAHLALVGATRCTASEIEPAGREWLATFADACGRHPGDLYLRFPEPVTEDLPGSVQFCVAVEGPLSPPPGTALVHRKSQRLGEIAFSRQADPYPEIRRALEALLEWHLAKGHNIAETAPEVHGALGLSDAILVAWPIHGEPSLLVAPAPAAGS
jgi:DNA-binding transcriptional MerR regulator